MIATKAPAKLALRRLLLAGGGTAGHVYPALAVLGELECQSLWLGSAGGLEGPLVRRADIEFRAIPAGAVVGRGPVALVRSALRNTRGFLAARAALAAYRPDVVLGTGGYVSVPAVVSARSMGIPTALFLPDVKPGLAIRAMSRVVDRIACTAGASRQFLPAEKVVVTGYPIRSEMRAWAERPDRRAVARDQLEVPGETPVVVVMGGSLGARSINRAVWGALERLVRAAIILHVAGAQGVEEGEGRRALLDEPARARYRPVGYAHDIGQLFATADLVVARAGASIMGELPAFGRPAIAIPGRFAGGHQRHNAAYLADAGAAITLADAALDELNALPDAVELLIGDPPRLRAMGRAAGALDRPNAALDVARMLVDLARGRSG